MKASRAVVDAAVAIVEALRGDHRTKLELLELTGTSRPTVQRALDWLRDAGAPIGFCRIDIVWYLGQEDWRIPTMLLPDWALRAELRELVGDADPIEIIRLAIDAGLLPQPRNNEISTRDLG